MSPYGPPEPPTGATVAAGSPAAQPGVEPVPPPPPGPGVVPPFPAPPTDRNRRGVWIGLGVGAGALAVCVLGAILGVVLLFLASNDQIQQQGRAAVTDFLGDVQNRQYAVARTQLCADRARALSPDDIRQEFGRSQIADFRVDGVTAGTDGLHVTTVINYSGADSRRVDFLVVQEGSDDTGPLYKVCGWS